MKTSILIEIEHTKYTELLDLEKETSRRVLLTTLEEGQKRAIVKFYVKKGNAPPLMLGEFEVSIPDSYIRENKRPKISVNGLLNGRRLKITGFLDNREVFSGDFRIGKYLRGPSLWPVFAIIGAILLVIAVLLLLLPGIGHLPERQAEKADTNRENIPATRPEDVTINQEHGSSVAPVTRPVPETREIRIPERAITHTVYFEPDSSEITPSGQIVLACVLEDIKNYSDAKIAIYGHCAVVKTLEGRIRLSRERAENTRDFLLSRNIAGKALDVQWFGGDRPVSLEEDKQNMNRRVEVIILNKKN